MIAFVRDCMHYAYYYVLLNAKFKSKNYLDLDFLFDFCFKNTIYLLNFNSSEMSVETIVAHPLYDGQRLLYDYAILRTKELIPFSRTVNAACLPQFTTPEVTDGKNLQISGWGKESKVYGEYKDTLILKVR
jgi:hypothetical protein